MIAKILAGIATGITLAVACVGLVAAASATSGPGLLLVAAGVSMPLAANQYYCTTERFTSIETDRYIDTIGNLNFGAQQFAGFVQAGWIFPDGSHLWPNCADGVVWMPAAGEMASTEEPLTRTIAFDCDNCRLTQITVAAHQMTDESGPQTGIATIRALDERGNQVGDTISATLNYNNGCVTINTGFEQDHTKIEISYSRGSELGIVDMTYCCGKADIVDEGCSPGYWKQPQHFGNWEGYTRNQDFDSVFGVNLFNPNITLLHALQRQGGGVNRLARHGVAALLDASSSGVFYPYTVAEVIARVQAGDADSLEKANELRCPLARNEHDDGHGHNNGQRHGNNHGHSNDRGHGDNHRR